MKNTGTKTRIKLSKVDGTTYKKKKASWKKHNEDCNLSKIYRRFDGKCNPEVFSLKCSCKK